MRPIRFDLYRLWPVLAAGLLAAGLPATASAQGQGLVQANSPPDHPSSTPGTPPGGASFSLLPAGAQDGMNRRVAKSGIDECQGGESVLDNECVVWLASDGSRLIGTGTCTPGPVLPPAQTCLTPPIRAVGSTDLRRHRFLSSDSRVSPYTIDLTGSNLAIHPLPASGSRSSSCFRCSPLGWSTAAPGPTG